jgi:hypothetical protein
MNLLTAGPVKTSEVIMLTNKVAHCHFMSETRQLFETEEGSYIYKMDKGKVFKLHPDKYITLLLKLITTYENHELKEQGEIHRYKTINE